MNGWKHADTRINRNQKLGDTKDENPMNTTRYQKLVGKLIYLSHTQPHISFTVNIVSHLYTCPMK